MFIKLIPEVIVELVNNINFWVENNLRNFSIILNSLLPYAMLTLGYFIYEKRYATHLFYLVLLIPPIISFIIFYLNAAANKLGKGTLVPIQEKRFTEIDEYGEVSVDSSRLQEMILYMADLEDWQQRKGLLP